MNLNTQHEQAIALPRGGAESVLATNKVIRNTYMLLSMTLAFSAVVAATSVALRLPHPGIILTLIGFFGLLFAVHKLKDSGWGIAAVFAMTGFMGYTLAPSSAATSACPTAAKSSCRRWAAPPRSSSASRPTL